MLKKLLLIVSILVFLCGCRPIVNDEIETTHYKIMSYQGIPSLCLLPLTSDDYDVTISDDINTFYNAFSKGEIEIIIAPIDIGVECCLNGNPYKLLSIVEYGNLYLASNDENCHSGDVAAYGENDIVGKLVSFLSETDLKNYNFIWYDNNEELIENLRLNNVNTLVLDELNFNNIVNYEGIELFKIEDLQEDYQYQTGFSSYPMFGMFILNDTLQKDQTNLVNFAKTIKNSINSYKTDKSLFNSVLKKADLKMMGFENSYLISETYNYCGLDFVYANADFESLKSILSICGIEINESIIVE